MLVFLLLVLETKEHYMAGCPSSQPSLWDVEVFLFLPRHHNLANFMLLMSFQQQIG